MDAVWSERGRIFINIVVCVERRAIENTMLDLLYGFALGLRDQKGAQCSEDHDASEEAQVSLNSYLLVDDAEAHGCDDGTSFPTGCCDAVRRTTHTSREDLYRKQERGYVDCGIEHKLGDREDGGETSSTVGVGDASPDGINYCHKKGAVKLHSDSAEFVWKKDAYPVARQVASRLNDDVTDGSVVESAVYGRTLSVADTRKDNGLIKINAVEGDVTGRLAQVT